MNLSKYIYQIIKLIWSIYKSDEVLTETSFEIKKIHKITCNKRDLLIKREAIN